MAREFKFRYAAQKLSSKEAVYQLLNSSKAVKGNMTEARMADDKKIAIVEASIIGGKGDEFMLE
jgi:hypothetical protein